jgi:hypothetical protein
MNTKKFSLLTVMALAVVVIVAMSMFMQNANVPGFSTFKVYAAGSPDSYGDYIAYVEVYQYISGSWPSNTLISSSGYSSGMNFQITSNVQTLLEVIVVLNGTLANSDAMAEACTAVNVTISGTSYTSAYLTCNFVSSGNGLYELNFWGPSGTYTVPPSGTYWTPATDTTYSVQITYQAYY